MSRAAWRGTSILYVLSKPATVHVEIDRLPARRRLRPLLRLRTRSGAGRRSTRLSGLAVQRLEPGRYRVRVSATDALGDRSASRTVSLRVR